MSAPEYITDIFGERCVVLSRCSSCGAPKFRREGERGSSQFHKDCLNAGSIGNEGHVEARRWSDQACERDYAEGKARGDFVATTDDHLRAPNPADSFDLGLRNHHD